jgi:hypothetical protein
MVGGWKRGDKLRGKKRRRKKLMTCNQQKIVGILPISISPQRSSRRFLDDFSVLRGHEGGREGVHLNSSEASVRLLVNFSTSCSTPPS